ncbi:hypothetical protein FYJ85_21155 [Victivallaceae bacterium BBE-744-WT-12]|uniref:Uncharacterized protein n=1 Tax=Victivallis lenta TaxID=2606640 RepID=A0A844G6K9_9BACT|nr:hypothetical protein [Victivallis lenta]MST99540.1 hypothetical protein [Victivallis lenta]
MTVINEMAREQMQSKGLLTGGYKQLGKFCQKELANDELAMFNHILLKLSTSCYRNLFDYLAEGKDFSGQSGEYAKQLLSALCCPNSNSYHILKLITDANYTNLQKVASESNYTSDIRSFIHTCQECDFALLCAEYWFDAIYLDMIKAEKFVNKNIFISNISVFSNNYINAIESQFAAIFSIIGMTKALSTDRTIKELEKYKDKIPELQNTIDILQQEKKEIVNDIKSELKNMQSNFWIQEKDAEDLYAQLPKITDKILKKARQHWNLSGRSLEDKLRKKLKNNLNLTPLKVNKRTEYWRIQDISKALGSFKDSPLSEQEWERYLERWGKFKKDIVLKVEFPCL